MDHDYETSKTCGCSNPYCVVCVGDLAVCRVCGLYEGSLTTECPGVQCYSEKSSDVYAGKIDFRNGQWVEGVTKHMQHIYGEN